MGLRSVIHWNFRYIRTVNSCDVKAYTDMINEILELKGGFTKRRYIWNIIRGKTFYITMANYVTNLVHDVMEHRVEDEEETMAKVDRLIEVVLTTEKNKSIQRNFINKITKQVPLVTVDIIRYMSYERVQNLLQGELIMNDDPLQPFIDEIARLRSRIE